MENEGIHGALVVNDVDGNHVGSWAGGPAQRVITQECYEGAWGAPFGWTRDTRAGLASVTKPIMAMVLMRMVEQGLVSLDDKISEALPPFMNFDNYLSSGNDDPTYRHLLQHRTGWTNACEEIHHLRTVQDFAEFFAAPALFVGEAPSCMKGTFKNLGPLDGLGISTYGNINYTLLRILLPLLTFHDQDTREKFWGLFEPLSTSDKYKWYNWWTAVGMKNLTPLVYQPAGLGSATFTRDVKTHAAGYITECGFMRINTLERFGADGIKQSAAELGLILSALAKGKILKPSTMSQMFDDTLGDPASGRLGWQHQSPSGLGWSHGGDFNGFHHLICFFKGASTGASCALLTNGGQIYQKPGFSSTMLWKDTLREWSYSCRD